MATRAAAILLSLATLAATAWLVRREARAYRLTIGSEAHRSGQLARLLTVPEPRDPRPAVVPPRPEVPARPIPPKAVAIVEAPSPPQSVEPREIRRPPHEPSVASPEPIKAKVSPVGLGKDPMALTLDEEKEVGQAVHDLIVARHKAFPAGPAVRRVLEAAKPILKQRERGGLDYEFTVLDSDDANAFSHAGGFVYLTRGLFDLIADDAELQFVLAHEIAHVDLRHALTRIAKADRAAKEANVPDPGLVQRVYHQIANGHSDAQEFEADARAFRQLIDLGRSRREARSFLQRYLGYVERHALASGHSRPKSALDADTQEVANHWPAHPAAMLRLDRLQDLGGAGR